MAKKKTTTKKAVKKTATKKTPVKKTSAKKAPAKKAAKKKIVTKKAAPKKAEKTTIIANVDVGFGNSLFIRGEGAGLSWEKGIALDNVSPYEWTFSTTKATGELSFKFLINDEAWADGDNLTVSAGGTSVTTPSFSW